MRFAALWSVVILLTAVMAAPALGQEGPRPGYYDGGQTEIAAGLLLGEDGRFEYGLSYGALDEQAKGRWERDGACALLTSDPFKQSEFSLVKSSPARPGVLRLELQLPDGIDAGYFDYVLAGPDGMLAGGQMQDGGVSVDLGEFEGPIEARIVLPVFGLASDPVPVRAGDGQALTFHFEPNEIGMVDLSGARLCDNGDGLELERHGRTLHFRLRPVSGGE